MTHITAYQVQQDGNWDPVSFSQNDLRAREVFILVNEERKELWIWIGDGADVRTRFISSNVAAEIRRLYGLTLRVRSADQNYEPQDFWNCLAEIPKEGLGPEVSSATPKLYSTLTTASRKPQKAPTKENKTPTSAKLDKKVSSEKLEETPSPLNVAKCPKCVDGYLLPYSRIVKVTARRSEILPYASWQCSSCGFSPQNPEEESEYE
ncbi:MAG: hypothetical protein EAX86_09810 [Candidatus Heimdallarchaeota archaeon]|nr:hypothetical protein [Candidatus Heimdallarchaeota archaeon]